MLVIVVALGLNYSRALRLESVKIRNGNDP